MKRKWAIRLTLLILLGAIMNIAVAWGFAYWQTVLDGSIDEWPDERSVATRQQMLPLLAPEKCARTEAVTITETGRRLDIVTVVYYGERYDRTMKSFAGGGFHSGGFGEDYYAARLEWAGWPMLALHGIVICDDFKKIKWTGLLLPGRNSGPDDSVRGYILPLTIVPTGFAINTIFYAAILWLLFFIPGKVRRAIRRRRGLCPACAYPTGTSPVCTECGERVYLHSISSLNRDDR